ncbi:trichothecene 3-O-acetyltransferas-like protein [Paraphoma chrysanthemicola]|uniref:Trichothecene 3-O-acetyltransferas-like protein n=1 Tax=Paraphoma chrysanthemicola TaxID=798071 RepID=A0A8K0RGF0_9PLEO|nr:trichothecene 3-O-acetyltransferas-like protein [Paraphoma chrysanthemicola]
MIVRTTTPPPAETKSFHLSFLDQNVVRVYTQTLSIFPFPDQNEAEAAIKALGEGLRSTLQRFPFLAGTLSLANHESGRLTLRYPTSISDDDMSKLMRTKQIPYDETTFPYTYEHLRKDGMPSSAFHAHMFVPDDFTDFPGIPEFGEGQVDFTKSDAPAMRVQACFIPGGLVLSMYIHHSILDCSGVTTFWTAFSANVSRVAGTRELDTEEIFAPVSLAEQQSMMRLELEARVPLPSSSLASPVADCYCDGIYKYKKTLPLDTTCSQKIFVMPAARVREFRDQLRRHFPEKDPPTMCNVLAALVWTHVTRARGKRLLSHGMSDTNVGIATDLRRRQQPPETAEFMGNMALFSKGTLKIADLLAEQSVTEKTILHVIKKIKSTIGKVNNDWIAGQMTFFKSIERIRDTECALALRFGTDIYITSWLNFAADLRWGIPGTDLDAKSLDGRPEFIRRLYNPSDGGMIFLPRRRKPVSGAEAPFEILVRLAQEDMDRVLSEPGGLKSWADAVID